LGAPLTQVFALNIDLPLQAGFLISREKRIETTYLIRATGSVSLIIMHLLAQVSQVFFHRLDFEFEFRQVGFQFLDLLGLGQEAALKTALFAAAIAATVAFPVLAITIFVHNISP
jgi:hypothetical protein